MTRIAWKFGQESSKWPMPLKLDGLKEKFIKVRKAFKHSKTRPYNP